MPGLVLDVLVIAAVAAVLAAPVRVVLGLLVATALLVPPTLAVPHGHSPYLTVHHVLVLAGLARLVLMRTQRVLAPGAMRRTPVHLAFTAVLLVSFVAGVVLVAFPGPLGFATTRLADLLDQFAFFVVVLALVRQLADPMAALTVLTLAVLVSAVVAVGEHLTGSAYGHWLFSRLPDQAHTDAAFPLQPRAGELRVRAGTEFALQLGWVLATALPAIAVVTLRTSWRRLVTPAALGVTALAAYWSYTRTAVAALGVILLLLAVAARERRTTLLVVGAFAVGALAYAAHPQLAAHYDAQADEGSITIRFTRLAPILGAVAHHPFRGLGLGELLRSGFATSDNTFLLEYAELGVLGVTALVVLFVVAFVQTARSIVVVEARDRMVAAACIAGVLAYLASTMVYDAFTLLQGVKVMWVLVAAATVLAEQRGHPVTLPWPSWRRVAVTGGAAFAVGCVAFAAAPVHFADSVLFTTLPTAREAAYYDPVTAGNRVVDTACGVVRIVDAGLHGASLDCRNLNSAAGMGEVRFEGGSRQELVTAINRVDRAVRGAGIPDYHAFVVGPVERGRTTVWRTAPVWAPLLAVGLLILVPWRRSATPGGGSLPARGSVRPAPLPARRPTVAPAAAGR